MGRKFDTSVRSPFLGMGRTACIFHSCSNQHWERQRVKRFVTGEANEDAQSLSVHGLMLSQSWALVGLRLDSASKMSDSSIVMWLSWFTRVGIWP